MTTAQNQAALGVIEGHRTKLLKGLTFVSQHAEALRKAIADGTPVGGGTRILISVCEEIERESSEWAGFEYALSILSQQG